MSTNSNVEQLAGLMRGLGVRLLLTYLVSLLVGCLVITASVLLAERPKTPLAFFDHLVGTDEKCSYGFGEHRLARATWRWLRLGVGHRPSPA